MGKTGVWDCLGAASFRRLLALILFFFGCALWGQSQSLASVFSPAASFSEKDIISPLPGSWGNKQVLLLNVPDGYEVYYSITGSDPLLFGFAYDGPSLIDKEGDVHLKISTVDQAGRRSDYTVDYSVKSFSQLDAEKKWSEEQRNFVRMIASNPLRKYTAGSVLSIPQEFSYRVDDMADAEDSPFFKGGLLSFGGENNIVRFVPFVVTDGQNFFRFIVRTAPAQENTAEATQLPFKISDWETILPLDASYSFRIDDGEWKSTLTALQLDRSETHVLFWKPTEGADTEKEESFVLFPKPSLRCSVQADGSCRFSLRLAPPYLKGYRLGRPESPSAVTMKSLAPAHGLHEYLVMDAFSGEDLSGSFTSGVYLDGVYQGTLSADFHLDRQPPLPPAIIACEADGFLFDDEQELRIECEAGASVFYAVSEGIPVDSWEFASRSDSLPSAPAQDFQLLDGDSIRLSTVGGQTSCYRVWAYAVDEAGNRGEKAERSLIVSGRNIYLRAASVTDDREEGDGSYEAPFSSLERAVDAINANKNLTLHTDGDIIVSSSLTIRSSCVIDGLMDYRQSSLGFLPGASIVVDHANVVFKNCSILKEEGPSVSDLPNDEKKSPVFVTVQDGRLVFDASDVSARFEQDGKLMELHYSSITAKDSSFSAYSASYSSLLTAYNSQIDLASSTCAVSSYTALVFCMVDSDLRLQDSVASVSCYTGRIAELTGGSCSFRGNVFNGALSAEGMMGELAAFRMNGETKELTVESNRLRGFTKW